MNFNQLINEIRKLNPRSKIILGNPELDPLAEERIYSSKKPSNLNLPEGFYYNEKNGITNKHNSETGLYFAIKVMPTRSMDEKTTLTESNVNKNIKVDHIVDFAKELQKLNPGEKIKLGNPNLRADASYTIFCSVSAKELVLPNSFYWNGRDGITNKHLTKKNPFICFYVKDLEKADSNTLINVSEENKKEEVNDIEMPSNPFNIDEEVNDIEMPSNPFNIDEEVNDIEMPSNPFNIDEEVNDIEMPSNPVNIDEEVNDIEMPSNPVNIDEEVNDIEEKENISNLRVNKVPSNCILCKFKTFVYALIVVPFIARRKEKKLQKAKRKVQRKKELEILKQKREEILKLESQARIRKFNEKLDQRVKKYNNKIEKINNSRI